VASFRSPRLIAIAVGCAMALPDPTLFAAFMLTALALNLTPGPDMAYVATRTLAEGRAAGLASALGIGAGALVHTALAVLGLSSLILYAPLLFDIVKYAGAAYLVWLAIQLWRDAGTTLAASDRARVGVRRAFVQGAVTNLLNPKVGLFFLALLPQFVDASRGDVAAQMLLLGLAFNVSGTLVNLAVALLTARARGAVGASPWFARALRRFAALLFVGFAARLALAER
jgi:threonine/homoserine/homoserine lactone efflux protein